jgi:hypothetical protein
MVLADVVSKKLMDCAEALVELLLLIAFLVLNLIFVNAS